MADVEDYLLEIEQELHDGRKAIFGSGVTVNGDVILSAVDKIRNALPEVIREARHIVATSEKRRQEDAERAQNMLAVAQKRANELLSENEIIKQAEREAAAIRAQAMDYRDTMLEGVRNDVGILLADAEGTLSQSLKIIKQAQLQNQTPKQG